MDASGWELIAWWALYVVPLIVTTWYAAWVGRNPTFWFVGGALLWPVALAVLLLLNAAYPKTPVDDPYGVGGMSAHRPEGIRRPKVATVIGWVVGTGVVAGALAL